MINLLPPSFKTELSKEEFIRLICILLLLLFLFLLSLSLLLASLRIYLGGEIKTTEAELLFQKEAFGEDGTREAITTLNKDIRNAVRFYRGQAGLSVVFSNIEKDLPDTMSLDSVTYTPSSEVTVKEVVETIPAKLTLSGFSPTREILFAFKENLEQDTLFEKVSFPPSNWVNARNITFSAIIELAL